MAHRDALDLQEVKRFERSYSTVDATAFARLAVYFGKAHDR
jgi:hypothetical protein